MSRWTTVCEDRDLIPDSGVCALLGDEQVAIFKLRKDNSLYAISNYDPIGKANVLSRGITGSLGDELVVASPLYKQHFSLTTGKCVEDGKYTVKTWPVRNEAGKIQLQSV